GVAPMSDPTRTELHQPVQAKAVTWAKACFGFDQVMDRKLRALRFLEEAIELVQAAGLSIEEVERVKQYVYWRPPGEIPQEVGGVMVTLGVFCYAHELQMNELGHREIERCWEKITLIRHKNLSKPRLSDDQNR